MNPPLSPHGTGGGKVTENAGPQIGAYSTLDSL